MRNQILALSHGTLADGMKVSIRVITGEQNAIDSICVMEKDSPATVTSEIRDWLDKQNKNIPAIIVTDIPFGSTTTLAAPLLAEYENLKLVSGMNLGMMLALVTSDLTAGAIVVKIQDILQQSKDTIFYVNDQLNQNEETDAEEDF